MYCMAAGSANLPIDLISFAETTFADATSPREGAVMLGKK